MKTLRTHPDQLAFREAQQAQIDSHRQLKTFREVPTSALDSMWVLGYKPDPAGCVLPEAKARMVVCENQKEREFRFIRAMTLSSPVLRILLALVVRFDLELR